MKSVKWIKVKLQETIKPNISNKSKNILGTDRVEQFMQRRNVEVSLSYHVIVVTLEEHMSYCCLQLRFKLSTDNNFSQERNLSPEIIWWFSSITFDRSSIIPEVSRVLTTHPATFPEICNGLLFSSILRMCVQNVKFVALSVPEIIGGTQKIWAVPGYTHAPFSPKFLKGFCSEGLCEHTCQIWSS